MMQVQPDLLQIYFGNWKILLKGNKPKLRQSQTAADEIVSMSKSMPFNQALDILSIFNKKFLGKIIIDPESRRNPIGIDIEQEHWMDAMEMILKANSLWYEEHENYIKITDISRSNVNIM